VDTLVIIAHSLLSVIVIALVLMHSGKDAGLSGAFGMGGGSSSTGGSTAIVERNLTRATIVVALLFTLTTYALSKMLN
jgi:preprotein translocase subunit SecG